MKEVMRYILVLGMAIMIGLPEVVLAQDRIDKEIVVVKPYQPSLSDAYKINILPMVSDSISIRPSFDYSIQPKKFDTKFQIQPITPARLVGAPLTKLYKSYLKLGFGNYLAPLVELRINSLRGKKSQWGIDLQHYSINGKLKLDNDHKVKPGYFDNSINIYGKRIFHKSFLSGKISGAYDGGNYYGYNPILGDTLLSKDQIQQNYLKLDGRLKMGSTHKDSLHLNYNGFLDYLYTYDHFKNFEHGVVLGADFNERFRSGTIYGLGLGGEYYYTSNSIDSANNTIIKLNPWFGKKTNAYIYKLGIGMAFDITGKKLDPLIYPEALLQINMVQGVLMPYFGVDGRMQVNNYRTVVEENRYIAPGLKVRNTHHKIRGYVGLKGSFSREISYDLTAGYSLIDNIPFYVNDTLDILGNTFNVVYDNIDLLKIRGELKHLHTEKLSGLLSVTWNQYKMDGQEKPWHMPSLLISLTEEYNLHNKILVDMSLFYIGKRYARPSSFDTEILTLKGFVDLNLGLEYRYTKILSGFVHLNNILGARNQGWNYYTGMGFNVTFGFTYAL